MARPRFVARLRSALFHVGCAFSGWGAALAGGWSADSPPGALALNEVRRSGGGPGGGFGAPASRAVHPVVTRTTGATGSPADEWLFRQQAPSGLWPDPAGASGRVGDLETSALALLCLVGTGHVAEGERYRPATDRTLRALLGLPEDEGRLGLPPTPDGIRARARVLMALSDTLRVRESPTLRRRVAGMSGALLRDAPTVLGWDDPASVGEPAAMISADVVLALSAAEASGFVVPSDVFRTAEVVLARHADPRDPRCSARVCAAALLWRSLRPAPGEGDEARALAQADFVLESLARDDRPERELLLYGTHALRQVGGARWSTWQEEGVLVELKRQHAGAELKGSWDPRSGGAESRLRATLQTTLVVMVYYRLDALFIAGSSSSSSTTEQLRSSNSARR